MSTQITNLAEFTQRVTRTVVSFERGDERYQNIDTLVILHNGQLAFDCGHSYTWYPHSATAEPVAGERAMCARCVADGLEEAQA